MNPDIIALVERYGAACRAEGIATVQFAQTKKAADGILETLKAALGEKVKKSAEGVDKQGKKMV